MRDWCRNSDVVLALENSGVRKKVTRAIKQEQFQGDPILSKILFPEESLVPAIFPFQCTRGFYAVAFALQAKKRLGLRNPVQCIGFGRRGHEGCPHWKICHNHHEEMLLWLDMWKSGNHLIHLEWDEFREELLASVHPKTFIDKSFRMTSSQVTANDMMTTLEAGLRNVQAIISMASDSAWYRHIPVERLQDMATHGLTIHPDNPTYLHVDGI